ncbi:MAG: hypothetical protein OK456_05060 [Thaumarchaeota archaeon]|nr:hypothetical protein [Nitrososphaerota archaeon]
MKRYLIGSGLVWVVVGFSILIGVNLLTLALGTNAILLDLNSRSWGDLASVFVFDSWGTAGGLAGLVVLFVPVLFGVPASKRPGLSIFFLFGSLVSGIIANVLWSSYYKQGGPIGAGSSSIALGGQGILFALSILGLARLLLETGTRGTGADDVTAREWRQFFSVVYLTLIVSALYFVIILEPIYIPTALYNWRVHQFAFLLAIAMATAFFFVFLQKRSR